MTTLTGIYSSLTGLYSFSAALNTISDNIANLNTPGFKGNVSLFRDLGSLDHGARDPTGRQDENAIGQGVEVAAVVRQFSQGDIQSTSNATDLAIKGEGFFVLSQGGQNVYTREGQFRFNGSGQLVDSVTGDAVQALGSDGRLQNLVIDRFQTSKPVPTTTASFTGILSTGSTKATVSNVTVIDASGSSRTLTLNFTNNTATTTGSWLVTVTDDKNNTIATNAEIRFAGDGSPTANFNMVSVNLKSANGSTSAIKLNFGDPGLFNGVTSSSAGTNSTVAFGKADGTALGTLSTITIDATGTVQLGFSNGKTVAGPQVALAVFSNPSELKEIGKALFAIPKDSNLKPILGAASSGSFGTIQAQSIELANIDLSAEFSKIIILQRGYQGASQVLQVSNKILEDLYNSVNGR